MHFFSIDQKIWHFFVKISQYFKDRFELAERALYVAKPRFMSASGRFMHLWCVSCGGAAGLAIGYGLWAMGYGLWAIGYGL